ncbi:acyl-coenzyme A diphosphatase FITM2 [Gadus morhua]|nr:fat storage-inducing transmembrane protein 2 [Gadus morhua]
MAACLDVIVEKLVSLWRISAVRQNIHWFFLVVSILGSVLKEFQLVPPSYFSGPKTFLNVYLVKVGWGWTLLLLTPFLLLSNSALNRDVAFLLRRVLSLVTATACWFVCTETFLYIENVTGSCFATAALDVSHTDLMSKTSCVRAGLHWHGFDVSGHSFLLLYSSLFIMEETAPMAHLKTASLSTLPRVVVQLLYIALNVLVVVWIFMFVCTSVYFHDPSQKLVGSLCAILAWHGTYRVWYLRPWSPGLPPLRQFKPQKQRA